MSPTHPQSRSVRSPPPMLRPDKRRPGGAIPRRRAAMLCRSSPHEITERHRDVPMLADGFRSWGRCLQSMMTLRSGAPVSLSLHRAAAASKQLAAVPTMPTPKSFRSSAVRFGRTVSSISFSQNAFSRPRLGSHTPRTRFPGVGEQCNFVYGINSLGTSDAALKALDRMP